MKNTYMRLDRSKIKKALIEVKNIIRDTAAIWTLIMMIAALMVAAGGR